MAIKEVEKLEDRLVIHYHLQKPYGIKDEDEKKEVTHESIGRLRSLPPFFDESSSIPVTRVIQDVSIPKLRKTITFVFESYSEKSAGPPEEELKGTYRREGNQGPMAINVF